MTWNDIWKMAPVRLSYIIRSMYDLLPSAANLVKWGKTNDDKCPLCQEKQTLEHVLSACKVSLAQGRYTWRHNKVLYELPDITDTARMKANRKIRSDNTNRFFLRAGQPTSHTPNTVGLPTIMKKYYDLVTALRRDGITARIIAVEVGARGLVAASVYDLLKQIGLKGQARTR